MDGKDGDKVIKVATGRPGTSGTVTKVDLKTGATTEISLEEARAEALKKRMDQLKAE